jgi:lipoate-protein ligase A
MICVFSSRTSPAFNLAAEQYLLSVSREDYFMLWQSTPAVIVGRNQNAWSQVNARFVLENRIPVIRRSSGGGAVYQDLGNINFTFIRSAPQTLRTEFRTFLSPVYNFLRKLEIPVSYEGRSDLTINGFKISGNAQHFHGGKVLHHGTMLFDADLSMLSNALRISPGKYTDKAVDSVRKKVANIRPYLASDLNVADFMRSLMHNIQQKYVGRRVEFSDADHDAITALAAARYGQWDWNFGHSPPYRFQNAVQTTAGALVVQLHVRAGIVREVRLHGNGLSDGTRGRIETALAGCRHGEKDMARNLAPVFNRGFLEGVSLSDLLRALF